MGKTKASFSGLVILLLLFITYIGLIGCNSGGGGGGIQRTITGTVSGGVTPKVGLFDDTYWFVNDPAGPSDVVDNEINGGPVPCTPIAIGTMNGGNFSMTIPEGSSDPLYLIVWDDDGDGLFAFGTETGYFAMKLFDAGTYAVEAISYIELFGEGEYCVHYYDGVTNYIEGFSIVGTSGFNMTIP